MCLQETHLKPGQPYSLRGYIFRRDTANAPCACSGVAILVKSALPYSDVDLQTNLQAIAVKLEAPIKITLMFFILTKQQLGY